ncbi:hypothetical protein, partial [Streptomyces sp. NPDC001165]|uniref:hypothetical protein n=1 Tax=Streptomyces sp. NPDC001165 TaxID=3364546 RepID=UPI0036B525D5
MEDLGAFGQQVEHVAVTVLGLRRRCGCRGELLVDAGEELGETAGAGTGRQDALLVVAELGQNQFEIALLFVVVDLGQQFGLGPAGARSLDGVLCGEADQSLIAAQGCGEAEKGQVVAGV